MTAAKEPPASSPGESWIALTLRDELILDLQPPQCRTHLLLQINQLANLLLQITDLRRLIRVRLRLRIDLSLLIPHFIEQHRREFIIAPAA